MELNYWAGGNCGNLDKLSKYLFAIPPSYNGKRMLDLVYQQVDPSVFGVGDYCAFAQYVLFSEAMLDMSGCLDSELI
jgi:hypothetical protein